MDFRCKAMPYRLWMLGKANLLSDVTCGICRGRYLFGLRRLSL